MKIADILSQIDLGAMALPEFQRGYVWNRNQVRELMSSLYRCYPVGGLLICDGSSTSAAHAPCGRCWSAPALTRPRPSWRGWPSLCGNE